MNYITSVTEIEITKLYKQKGITSASQLNIADLSHIFNISVYFVNFSSKLLFTGQKATILVDSRLTLTQQLESFYHELAHYLLEHQPTNALPLFKYFETKADNLIQYLAIPFYLLDQLDLDSPNLIQDMSESFGVSYELCLKRIDNIKAKLIAKGDMTGERFCS